MHNEEVDHEPPVGIAEVFSALPLFNDDLYLTMQAMNLDLVDQFIIEQETALLQEYFELERTPVDSTFFVSALSQLWLFGLYELLRTWRQRVHDLLRWRNDLEAYPIGEREARVMAKKVEIERRTAVPRLTGVPFWSAYEEVASDPLFGNSLREAFDRTERLFRRIEAFRITLAKHELPRAGGSFAMAPGYGRIDMTNGSISWEVVLHGDEVDRVSRREVADQCRRLAHKKPLLILPPHIQEKIKKFPTYSYGVKRVAVILEDGSEVPGVYVAWAKEVIAVRGGAATPFAVNRVVDVRHDSHEDSEST